MRSEVGATTHATIAAMLTAMTMTSNRENGIGIVWAPRCLSQLPVKLGTMRPPISTISVIVVAIASRAP